jgi:hypothetical protein
MSVKPVPEKVLRDMCAFVYRHFAGMTTAAFALTHEEAACAQYLLSDVIACIIKSKQIKL